MKKIVADYRIKRPEGQKDLVSEVFAVLNDRIEFHEGERVLDKTISPATPGQRAVFSCYWYQYEVCNGGHQQFFENSTGILWEEAIAGFNRLNAPQYAAILQGVILLFPKGNPAKDRKKRYKQLAGLPSGQLDKFDDQLYELMKKEDFDEILAHYINTHDGDFFLPQEG
jgi:hypothetical protein